ncbi:MAG: diguanylate cyclase [Actinomycetota bacterium]|nr:diguanylate cyclase [Actinomycetota bacterium]
MPSNATRRWRARRAAGPFVSPAPSPSPDGALDREGIARLLAVVRHLGASSDLPDLLQRIATSVVEVLGFEMAAINLVEADGDLRVVAVAGPIGVEQMRDERAPRALFDELLACAEPWGSLRFFDHRLDHGQFAALPTYSEDVPGAPAPESWHPLDSLFAPMHGSTGELLGILSVDRPESGRRPNAVQRLMLELFAAEGARAIEEHSRRVGLIDAEALYRRAFELMPLGVAILDEQSRLIDVNQAFSWLVGERRTRLIGQTLADALGAADAALLIECCHSLLSGSSGPTTVEHPLVRHGGARRFIRSRVTAVRGIVAGDRAIIQSEDVTAERELVAELEELARHDALTGLPNRRAALERIAAAIERRRPGEVVAVLFCDLDGFKAVNDTRGHVAGDHVLSLVGQRLRTALRDGDVLFRIGGDEFLGLCERLSSPRVAAAIGRRLIAALGNRQGGEVPSGLSLSIGVAYLDDAHPDRSALELVSAADHALYRAKREGRGRLVTADSGGSPPA